MPRSDAQPTVERRPRRVRAPPTSARRSAPRSSRTCTSSPRSSASSRRPSSSARGSSRATSPTWREPGSYLTTDVVDQPVLVVRDHDGEIRAFRNVCRHRGSRLLAGSGSVRQGDPLPLPRLDLPHSTARLIGVPEGRDIPDLDKSRLGLHQVRAEVFCGLIFVNLDPGAEPLGERLGGLAERLARYDLPSAQSASARAATSSRRTGRSSSRTTSRATTSRSRTRR